MITLALLALFVWLVARSLLIYATTEGAEAGRDVFGAIIVAIILMGWIGQ